MKRPDCRGWYVEEPICTTQCSYRSHCLALVSLAGGLEKRTRASVAQADATYSHEELDAIVTRSRILARTRKKVSLQNVVESPETGLIDPNHKHARAIIMTRFYGNMLADLRCVRLMGAVDDCRTGDLYIKLNPGSDYRRSCLYEYNSGRSGPGLWIARFIHGSNRATLIVQLNCDRYDMEIRSLGLPSGPTVRLWQENRPILSFRQVKEAHLEPLARFTQALMQKGYIGELTRRDHLK